MALQKAMHFFRQFRSDAFGRRDLFHGGFPQAIDRSEFTKEQTFPVLTHARTIIQNTFADPLLHQQLVIGICEAVRFVANALQANAVRPNPAEVATEGRGPAGKFLRTLSPNR